PNIVTSGAVVTSKNNINILEDKEHNIEVNLAKTMYATANVNVRQNDNLESDIITVIKRGETVKIFEKQNNGWSKVLYKHKIYPQQIFK
ncbi:MAG: SH3 domain-containing protein, partial [Lachnospiraceae bacterium]|nr:SH3 domain-containing protein [Lachnospiraceae bacterium]